MLLETLDLRTNDVLIYSQNLFNFNDSFKIIFKNAKVKSPQRISYFDVCSYIKDPAPKNLIIYRLLTNVTNLDAYSTKYGYFIKINSRVELIYFDPVFAIKDLRHLRFDFNPDRFRFKIQQVGLTSLTKKEIEPNFAEVYSFDLRAVEAQHQNDKIFADAIFAFDPGFVDEDKPFTGNRDNPLHKDDDNESINSVKIIEEKGPAKTSLNQPSAHDTQKAYDVREEIVDLLKQALGIENTNPASQPQLNTNNESNNVIKEEPDNSEDAANIFDLFKSTNKTDELTKRQKESVILKFNK